MQLAQLERAEFNGAAQIPGLVTSQQIRDVMATNRPFFVKTNDGAEYFVRHQDFISVGDDDFGLAVVHTDTGMVILDLANITALDLRQSAAAG